MYYFPQESHLDPTRIPHLYCLPKVSLLVSRNLLRFSNFPLPFISLSLKGNHINTPIYPFISQLQLATTSSHPPPGSSLLLLEAILLGESAERILWELTFGQLPIPPPPPPWGSSSPAYICWSSLLSLPYPKCTFLSIISVKVVPEDKNLYSEGIKTL